MTDYQTAAEIEVAVARYFNPRINIIVPNVTWGLNLPWECDLAIATKAHYLNEVEIKISKADLLRDKKKDKWTRFSYETRIRNLWFAVPEKIRDCLADIPERAGLLVVTRDGWANMVRSAKTNTIARKLGDDEFLHLAHLGAMRIWDLKRALIQARCPAKEGGASAGREEERR